MKENIFRIIFYKSTKNIYEPIRWCSWLLCKGIYKSFFVNMSFSNHFKYLGRFLSISYIIFGPWNLVTWIKVTILGTKGFVKIILVTLCMMVDFSKDILGWVKLCCWELWTHSLSLMFVFPQGRCFGCSRFF
jgi:hypothetical protein